MYQGNRNSVEVRDKRSEQRCPCRGPYLGVLGGGVTAHALAKGGVFVVVAVPGRPCGWSQHSRAGRDGVHANYCGVYANRPPQILCTPIFLYELFFENVDLNI